MKLLFVCASLEPGKDGVGDYTRKLSFELSGRGIEVTAVAFNDKFKSERSDTIEENTNGFFNSIRLPAGKSLGGRLSELKEIAAKWKPDYISLQYVPFGFNKRGLPLGLPGALKKINCVKWHIMFHELWVGMEVGASLKMRLWGFVQRLLIGQLVRKLRPAIVHSQIPLYVYQLQKMGIKAELLPLFGNINVPESIQDSLPKKEQVIKFLIFGNLHHSAPVAEFSKQLNDWLLKNGKKCKIIFAGNNGPEAILWKSEFEKNGFEILTTGFLSNERLAELFLYGDVGIASTPDLLIGKSGAAAAMKDFGLPVVCVAREWNVNGYSEPRSFALSFEDAMANYQRNFRPFNFKSVSTVTDTLLSGLNGKH